jgi:hypothetical protein
MMMMARASTTHMLDGLVDEGPTTIPFLLHHVHIVQRDGGRIGVARW